MGTQLAAYRNEIARQFNVIDQLKAEVKELLDEVARLRARPEARFAEARAGTGSCHMESGTCVHAKNAIRLEANLVQMGREMDEVMRERDALKRLLRRWYVWMVRTDEATFVVATRAGRSRSCTRSSTA